MERPEYLPRGERFKDYFKTADIVILAEAGEGHGKHKRTISAFLGQFGSRMSGLFFELSTDLQKDIDTYLDVGEVTSELESLFDGASQEGKALRAETLAVFDRAREKRIPVICFDASKVQAPGMRRSDAKEGYWFIKGECRDADMFENVLNTYKNRPGKYAVIIGSHHMTDENFAGDFKNFGPRIRAFFGSACAAVKMTDHPESAGEFYDDVIVAKDGLLEAGAIKGEVRKV